MPSDSIAGFLDRAQASHVLFPEQVAQLIRQPDIPQTDLSSLCTYLLSRGVLTQFQADALRDGRGHELSFGGYPVLDMLGSYRGGTAYRALHPSLRTPLVLVKFDMNSFAPTDNADAVIGRARNFGTIQHPNLLPVLDAGVYQAQAYAVFEQPADAADLATMLKEVGGAMPAFLAAEYGWAIASALRAIHERGGWHGEVRPGVLVVSPLVIKANPDGSARRRPAPNASVKLTDTGLVAMKPPAATEMPDADLLAYLPPERIDGNTYEPRGDIYGLGASLYLLLAGRPPFTADSPQELLLKVRSVEPAPLATMRPDAPPELCAAVMKMLAKRPEDRPQTAYDVCESLAPFCRPGTLPPAPQPRVVPNAPTHGVHVVAVPYAVPHAVPVATAEPVTPPEPDGWGVSPNAFAEAQAASTADTTQPRRRQLTQAEKSKSWLWIAVGLCLHMSAVGLLIAAWQFGWFGGSPKRTPATEPSNETEKPKPNKTNPKPRPNKGNPSRDPG